MKDEPKSGDIHMCIKCFSAYECGEVPCNGNRPEVCSWCRDGITEELIAATDSPRAALSASQTGEEKWENKVRDLIWPAPKVDAPGEKE